MSRTEDSSPLASVDDIHRRLLRPSSLHSPEDVTRGSTSSQLKANPTPLKRRQEEKQRETTKKKLEDYLDPVLLAAISSKIGSRAKIPETKSKREDKEFEWPVDKLKVFMEDSRTEKRNSDDVNLRDDSDLIGDGSNGEGEFCTPFWRFEQTALKRFKVEDSKIQLAGSYGCR